MKAKQTPKPALAVAPAAKKETTAAEYARALQAKELTVTPDIYYEMMMSGDGCDVQDQIACSREEYIELKVHLATLRGFTRAELEVKAAA